MPERHTATKIRIRDLLNATIIERPGWGLSYFQFNNKKVFKINLIALTISIDKKQIVVDDGTGNILVRLFKDTPINLRVGSPVLIIGNLRTADDEKYLVSDILSVLENRDWLKVRKIELKEIKPINKIVLEKIQPKETINSYETIIAVVKKLDKGDGVNIEQILAETQIADCKNKINNLLIDGTLFEINKDKVKLLN